ncbi:hypothetical protein KY328_02340, partial [Candidatus Woesearchaeota archaeon]|nr:hypothetical protein [Candidatus Woesearchaeota archaeon]
GNDLILQMGGNGNDIIQVGIGLQMETRTVVNGTDDDTVQMNGGKGDDTITYNVNTGSDIVNIQCGPGIDSVTIIRNINPIVVYLNGVLYYADPNPTTVIWLGDCESITIYAS